MAIAMAFRGFNDLRRTVTPVFLLMDHFLYQFSAFSEKMKKIYRLEVWIFCKMHDRIPFFLALRSSMRRFQMPFEQEIIKVREWIPHIGPLTKVIPPKLFLDIVPSFFADITRALRGCFRGGSLDVSFRFKAKENLQRCGDVFFDILITSKGPSALAWCSET